MSTAALRETYRKAEKDNVITKPSQLVLNILNLPAKKNPATTSK